MVCKNSYKIGWIQMYFMFVNMFACFDVIKQPIRVGKMVILKIKFE